MAEDDLHKTLVEASFKYLVDMGCGVVISDVRSGGECPDVLGWYKRNSIMIECKTTASDLCDRKSKLFRKYPEMGVGVYRYYCIPKGLEIPNPFRRWGVLEYENGGLTKTKPAEAQGKINSTHETLLLLNTLLKLGGVDEVVGVSIRWSRSQLKQKNLARVHVNPYYCYDSEIEVEAEAETTARATARATGIEAGA
jgi:hypothetical protein